MKNAFDRLIEGLAHFFTIVNLGNMFSRPTGNYAEMNIFQRMGYFMLVGFLVFMGLITAAMQGKAHRSGKDAFEGRSVQTSNHSNVDQLPSENEAFRVIAVYEKDNNALRQLSRSIGDEKLTQMFTIEEKAFDRLIYSVKDGQIGDLPKVNFWQKLIYKPDTFESRTFGKSHSSPIYAVFNAPNALGKFKAWAKNNGYRNWDFQLKYEAGWGSRSTYTESLDIQKPGSTISIISYFQSSNGLYIWDGEQTIDCSDSINSNVGGTGGADKSLNHVNWLQRLGQ